MSELKCPFCHQELGRKNINDMMCSNEKCITWKGNFYGSEDLWRALINERQHATDCQDLFIEAIAQKLEIETELERTRKALDVANEKLKHCVNMTLEELDELKGNLLIAQDALLHFSKDPIANNALKKITALEQKDVK